MPKTRLGLCLVVITCVRLFVCANTDLSIGVCDLLTSTLIGRQTDWLNNTNFDDAKFFSGSSNTKDQFCDCSNGTNIPAVYAIFTENLNFTDSIKACSSRGAQLAKITSSNEKNVLGCLLKDVGGGWFYIGLNRSEGSTNNKSSFKWLDGTSSLLLDLWRTGEPNMDNERCVQFHKNNLDYRDVSCDKKSGYICYTNLSTYTTTETTTSFKLDIITSKFDKTTELRKPDESQQTTETQRTEINSKSTTTTTATAITTKDTTTKEATDTTTIEATVTTKTEASATITKEATTATTKTKPRANIIKETYNVTNIPGIPTRIKLRNADISIQVESPDAFSFQVNLLQPIKQVVKTASTGNVKLLVGYLLDITPDKYVTNITIKYNVAVDSNSADNLISGIYKSHEGQFKFSSLAYKCAFQNETSKTYSFYGMSTVINNGKVECTSNHTTIFAVLLSVTGKEVPTAAKTLSYVLESISIASLLLTLLILIKARSSIRNERTFAQINLTLALLLFHTASVLQDVALNNSNFCEFIAVTLHLTILGSAFWMLVEGVSLFLKTTVQALKSRSQKKTNAIKMLIGWGIPVIILVCSTTPGFVSGYYMDQAGLGRYKQCWIENSNPKSLGILIGAVIVPIAFTLAINFFILTRMGFFIYKMSKQTEGFRPITASSDTNNSSNVINDHLKASIRATVMLLPILSVPWILFLLIDVSDAFLYLTIVVNGLQGFFVLLVYCVYSREVRGAAISSWNNTKVGKKLTIKKSKSKLKVNGTEDIDTSSTRDNNISTKNTII